MPEQPISHDVELQLLCLCLMTALSFSLVCGQNMSWAQKESRSVYYIVVDFWQYAVCRSLDLSLLLGPLFVTLVFYCPYVLLSLHALGNNCPVLTKQLEFLQICYCRRGMAL